MNKVHALNENELEKVNGGAGGGSIDINAKKKEFNSAWESHSLSLIYPGEDKKNELFNSWAANNYPGSAFDFLLPYTK